MYPQHNNKINDTKEKITSIKKYNIKDEEGPGDVAQKQSTYQEW
jgi:hypothetical protein